MNNRKVERDRDKKTRILLVDDEPEFLEATASALSRRGFNVWTAERGVTALELLGEHHLDVVVLDVKMPGLDGVEVFQRISAAHPDLPVIMLTGHGSVQQAFETSREGVFEYLSKPCDMEKLACAARRAVEDNRERSGPAAAEPEDDVRLLLVDDEAELLESLAAALGRRGMRVPAAPDGAVALEQIQQQVFDVALVDVKMRGLCGLALLRRIRALQPLMEVIMLTGHPSMETAVEGLREGAFDFMAKPQSVDVLVQKIRQASRLRQLRKDQADRREVQQIIENKPR